MKHPCVIDAAEAEEAGAYPAPSCVAIGHSRGRYANPEGFPLWFVVGHLEAGCELIWNRCHGDEVVYVRDGLLDVDGSMCETGGVLIVESEVTVTARAVHKTAVVHFGPVSEMQPGDGPLGPPAPEDHGVHIRDEHSRALGHFYADSDCPTCRLTLMRVALGPDANTPSHTHSTDEIIYLLSGDIQSGPKLLEPGMAIAIAGNYRYRLRTKTGCEYLNYRRDASLYTSDPKGPRMLETVRGIRGFSPA